MRYARIEQDVVVEFFVTDDDITQIFHPDLIWVECPSSEITEGWRYKDGAFLPPLPSEEDPRRYGVQRSGIRAEISIRKNQFRDGGFYVDGRLWDSDQSARLAYAELAQRLAADPEFVTRWKASEGIWVDMTADLFAKVYAAGAAHIAVAFAWQEAEEARLAATPDDALYEFVVSTPQGV